MAQRDPTHTDPDKYRTIFENHLVRVLEYRDEPGARTQEHHHPQSVMYTLSAFTRRIGSGDRSVVVEKQPGEVNWLDAQEHFGENVGTTQTHVIFVELKAAGGDARDPVLGPRPG